MAECPVCGADVSLGENPVMNELISCSDCGVDLEVTGLNPVGLSEAPMEEEDWGQ